ncbi:phosphoglycerate mutase family protein [Shewanella sp. 5_MG-2023]|uniref:SixA phosphatase family protein n=1 Tax=Shewanella sp. 5_MG-2023 TaxID=3062656 RepID=UPI0026E44D3C|nr:phosphoglycerate mutase family protein [Shewanella sp. 5_MG-2023]MDO6640368.1 phosphoglycerate mutase family protein [Shewanella sp. 5_MG-2023]
MMSYPSVKIIFQLSIISIIFIGLSSPILATANEKNAAVNSHNTPAMSNASASTSHKTSTIFLVRHGEKQTGEDPQLTEQGKNRALALANTLSAIKLDAVYSTQYQRTEQTALPTANSQYLKISYYNPRELAEFASQLQLNSGAKVLVVGHSNTTPKLVNLLGGEPGTEINEKSEFDRLYIVTIFAPSITEKPAAQVSTTLLKY